MAKKKKARKKVHRARSSSGTQAPEKAVASAPAAAATSTAATSAAPTPTAKRPVSRPAPSRVSAPVQMTNAGRWAYVRGDLRRVGVLVFLCIVVEAVVWILFNHTNIGTSIYNQINL